MEKQKPLLLLLLPLRGRGIAHSLQERQQVFRARVRRHTVLYNMAPLSEYSADILVPPRHKISAQCCFS